jgi:hypothetical protein
MANAKDDSGAVFAAILLGLFGGGLAALVVAVLSEGAKPGGAKPT